MKRGISALENDLVNEPEQKITKTLEQLLLEVFNGDYDDFRRYLKQENRQKLDLSAGKARGANLKHLGQALKGTSATTVKLSDNNIGPEGAAAFGQALQGTNVTKVYLDSNNIGNEGAAAFGQALQGTNVTTVYLDCNNIGNEGAAAFGQALQGTSVTSIGLGYNNIDDKGAAAFGQALQGTNVTTVNLFNNNIDAQAHADFYKALDANKRRLAIPPYLVMNLERLSNKKKLKHFNLGKEQFGSVEYAGGIIANLPADAVNHIVSFLPLMAGQATKYRRVMEEFHKGELAELDTPEPTAWCSIQ